MNIKFNKDRAPFKKGEIIEVDEKSARLMMRTDPKSVSIVKDEPNFDGAKLSSRQKKDNEKMVEDLKKKAKDLENARK